ncbi:hypothetical protein EJB05_53633, partial [Eragrostis curvula]
MAPCSRVSEPISSLRLHKSVQHPAAICFVFRPNPFQIATPCNPSYAQIDVSMIAGRAADEIAMSSPDCRPSMLSTIPMSTQGSAAAQRPPWSSTSGTCLLTGRAPTSRSPWQGGVLRAPGILAARSPVFRSELYGAMAENDPRRAIEMVDVEPTVFEMLLNLVYTDSLPGGTCASTMQHLLVTADRYVLDRLKLMCAEKLHRSIDVTTVMATLALADQHQWQLLPRVQRSHACAGERGNNGVEAERGDDNR